MAILITALCGTIPSVISGIVLFIVQTQKKEQNEKHEKQIKAAFYDRQLLLAISEVSEMTARKVSGDNINGELHDAIGDLVEKRNDLTKFTNEEYIRHIKE